MLYIVNKNSTALIDCIERASETDVILLIEHAVYAARVEKESSIMQPPPNGVVVYALQEDMQARGIQFSHCYDFIQYVDYAGFVGLVESNNPIRSCF
jgi:sulfur relay protein TusB/DsrH